MDMTISHQTVQLSRGRHASPDKGACVMELASMLAGEQFSDHPKSVCPSLGAILRPYNDSLDEERRRDLYEYAARVVGTRTSRQLTRERADQALAFFIENDRPGHPMPLRVTLLRRLPGTHLLALARATARFARRIDTASHAEVLALLDRLIEMHPAGATDELPDAASVAPRPTTV
jgi:hypothetical protein